MSVPKVFSGLTESGFATEARRERQDQGRGGQGYGGGSVAGALGDGGHARHPFQLQYDRHHAGDFSKIVQQMSQRGAISQQDAQELSSIRVDLENAGVNPDQSVNLVQFYQQQLAKAQAASAQSSNPAAPSAAVNALVARLNWVQKLAAMSQSGASGVNTVA